MMNNFVQTPSSTPNATTLLTPVPASPASTPIITSVPASPKPQNSTATNESDRMIGEEHLNNNIDVSQIKSSVLSQKRPMGVKAAKNAKRQKIDQVNEALIIQSALEKWTESFKEVSESSIAASKDRNEEHRINTEREYELKKEAVELDNVKILFSGDDEESKKYREALKKKRLRKLLREEEDDENRMQ